jgi:hypothetical protein
MRLSGSRVWQAERCGWAFRPDAPAPRETSGAPAEKGRALHALVEHAGDYDLPESLSESDRREVRSWWAAWRASPWAGLAWQHEVAFAYDFDADRARVLPAAAHRDYSACSATEIPATADLVLDDPERDRVIVADIKTGYGDGVRASEHPQLRFLALAAARVYGRGSATVYLLDVGADGVAADEHTYDCFALAESAEWVAGIARQIPTSQPQAGAHCGRCPVAHACPALHDEARALVPLGTEPRAIEINADTAPELLAVVQRMEAFVEAAKAALKVYATTTPIPTSAGKEWAPSEVAKSEVRITDANWPMAHDLLLSAGALGAVETTRKVTKKALEEAVRSTGAPVKPTVERLLADLDAAGAVSRWTETRFAERKARG